MSIEIKYKKNNLSTIRSDENKKQRHSFHTLFQVCFVNKICSAYWQSLSLLCCPQSDFKLAEAVCRQHQRGAMKDKRNKVPCLLNKIMFYNVFSSTVVKDCVYVALVTSILLTCFILNLMISEDQQLAKGPRVNFPTDLKYILFWKQPSDNWKYLNTSEKDELLQGQSMFINQKCEYINCFITYNKNLLHDDMKNFDVVVFNINEIYTVKRKKILLSRSPKQIYIFNSMDSGLLFPVCFPGYDNFFNLTWTYRLSSDIPQPFFKIYNTRNELIGPIKRPDWIMDMEHTQRYNNKIRNKTKAVAWIVNKCRSKRKHNKLITELGKELRSYNYTLDIYGHCGAKKCLGKNMSSCYELIERNYFFQLVLEDTTSVDHVSTRMALAMQQMVVPIVQGGPEYDSYLPPGSYINVENVTMKELGAIINYLIRNPQYYEYFFDWKNYYRYEITPKNYLCDLCAYINQNAGTVKLNNHYFRNWWNPNHRVQCTRKRLYDIFYDYDYV